MKIEMHEIKANQLSYYRMSLGYLKAYVDERKECLDELEGIIRNTKGAYTHNAILGLRMDILNTLDKALEVYNLRTENTLVSDSEFLEMALSKKKEQSDYSKTHAKGRFKTKEEYENFIRKCQCEKCKELKSKKQVLIKVVDLYN